MCGNFVAFFLLSARHNSPSLFLYLEVNYVILKLTGKLECGNCTFRYRNFLISFGITANAGFTSFQAEGAKATDFYVVTFSQDVLDALEQGINYYCDVFADNPGIF